MKVIRALSVAVAGVVMTAACDIPTGAPILVQSWVIAVEGDTISIEEFLPAGVTVVGNSFSIDIGEFASSETLGVLCPDCGDLHQLGNVPVPAFNGNFTGSNTLPDSVTSAVVTSGTVDIEVKNNLNFDPLTSGGSIGVTMTDGVDGPEVGGFTMDSTNATLEQGDSVTQTMTLNPGAIQNTLVVNTNVDVPLGITSLIDTTQTIEITATPTSLLVASVDIDLNGREVNFGPQTVDIGDIDTGVTDNIVKGQVTLQIGNPSGATIETTISLGPVVKSVEIPATATATVTIEYTGDELRQILGQQGVTFRGAGTINSAGPTTVTPAFEVTLLPQIGFTIAIGG